MVSSPVPPTRTSRSSGSWYCVPPETTSSPPPPSRTLGTLLPVIVSSSRVPTTSSTSSRVSSVTGSPPVARPWTVIPVTGERPVAYETVSWPSPPPSKSSSLVPERNVSDPVLPSTHVPSQTASVVSATSSPGPRASRHQQPVPC